MDAKMENSSPSQIQHNVFCDPSNQTTAYCVNAEQRLCFHCFELVQNTHTADLGIKSKDVCVSVAHLAQLCDISLSTADI